MHTVEIDDAAYQGIIQIWDRRALSQPPGWCSRCGTISRASIFSDEATTTATSCDSWTCPICGPRVTDALSVATYGVVQEAIRVPAYVGDRPCWSGIRIRAPLHDAPLVRAMYAWPRGADTHAVILAVTPERLEALLLYRGAHHHPGRGREDSPLVQAVLDQHPVQIRHDALATEAEAMCELVDRIAWDRAGKRAMVLRGPRGSLRTEIARIRDMLLGRPRNKGRSSADVVAKSKEQAPEVLEAIESVSDQAVQVRAVRDDRERQRRSVRWGLSQGGTPALPLAEAKARGLLESDPERGLALDPHIEVIRD